MNSVANLAASNPMTLVRLGTRTSQLALWQTNHVAAQLQQYWPTLQCQLIHHVTQGDKRLDRPLPEIGGKGLFTAELEEALRQGEIDLAVHSLKDLPVEVPDDLVIGAILSREDTRDVLVARENWTLDTLPQGAVVGTSSLRRQAQLLAVRPDLVIRSIRGNVDTRLRKVMSGEYDAAVMAGAGLSRLGLTERITEWLEPEAMLCAPGQGALGVQCRANDEAVLTLLSAIHDAGAAATTTAERHLLYSLGGGCSAPIGAWATVDHGVITLRARVTSVDGVSTFNATATSPDPIVAAEEAASLLVAQGAQSILHQNAKLPLQDKRVVVTRPISHGGQGGDLEAVLQAQGATTLSIPAIQLVPVENKAAIEQSLAQLSTYDWLIFTSPNAVEFFWQAVGEQGGKISTSKCRIAAVGPVTADVLRNYSLDVDVMPEQFLGSEIPNILGDVAGKRILLPRSAKGSDELPNTLRANGAVVDDLALYMPVPSPIDTEAQTLLAAGVDVITFASGSAVNSFVQALQVKDRFADFWTKVIVACIGPTTADVARSHNIPVHIVAQEHTAKGLVSAIVAYFEGANNG